MITAINNQLIIEEPYVNMNGTVNPPSLAERLPPEGDSLIKVGTDVWAQKLGISGVNFCQAIRFWEVNFAWGLGLWQFLTKKN